MAFCVTQERERSVGRVELTDGIEQKRCGTRGSIVVCGVEVKRSSANGGVETARGVGKERKEPNRSVEIGR